MTNNIKFDTVYIVEEYGLFCEGVLRLITLDKNKALEFFYETAINLVEWYGVGLKEYPFEVEINNDEIYKKVELLEHIWVEKKDGEYVASSKDLIDKIISMKEEKEVK